MRAQNKRSKTSKKSHLVDHTTPSLPLPQSGNLLEVEQTRNGASSWSDRNPFIDATRSSGCDASASPWLQPASLLTHHLTWNGFISLKGACELLQACNSCAFGVLALGFGLWALGFRDLRVYFPTALFLHLSDKGGHEYCTRVSAQWLVRLPPEASIPRYLVDYWSSFQGV